MWVPSTSQWNLIARVVVQRSSPCGNLSDMIPISVPTTCRDVIGLKSESVIGFNPES